MKYFWNWFLTAIVAAIVAVLTFLFADNEMSATAAAMWAGAACGVSTATAYTLGAMMEAADCGEFNGKRFGLMVLAGVVAGLLGGLLIGVG